MGIKKVGEEGQNSIESLHAPPLECVRLAHPGKFFESDGERIDSQGATTQNLATPKFCCPSCRFLPQL